MNRSVLNKLAWVFALLLLLGAAACGDDDDSGNGANDSDADRSRDTNTDDTGGDTPVLDTGLDDTGGETGNELCDAIPAATNLNGTCAAAAECGDGGVCLDPAGGTANVCLQVCVPNTCTDVCAEGEACAGLVDAEGNPVQANGVDLGACVAQATGDTGAYELCNPENLCEAGMDCLVQNTGDADGQCSPQCDGQGSACPSAGEFPGSCVLVTSAGAQTPDHCGVTCPAAGDGTGDGCPDGMTCTVTGDNTVGLCGF